MDRTSDTHSETESEENSTPVFSTRRTLLSLAVFTIVVTVVVPLAGSFAPASGQHGTVTADIGYDEYVAGGAYKHANCRPRRYWGGCIPNYDRGWGAYNGGPDSDGFMGMYQSDDRHSSESYGDYPAYYVRDIDLAQRHIAIRDKSNVHIHERGEESRTASLSADNMALAMNYLITANTEDSNLVIRRYAIDQLNSPTWKRTYTDINFNPGGGKAEGTILNGGQFVFAGKQKTVAFGPNGDILWQTQEKHDILERGTDGRSVWIADIGGNSLVKYSMQSTSPKKRTISTMTVRGFEPVPSGGFVVVNGGTIRRLNGDGSVQWQTSAGVYSGENNEVPVSISSDDEIVVAGGNYGMSGAEAYKVKGYHLSNGSHKWSSRKIPGASDEIVTGYRDTRQSTIIREITSTLSRLETITRLSAIVVSAISLIVGLIAVFMSRSVSRKNRAREFIKSGGIGILAILSIDTLYACIAWVFTGSTNALPYIHGVPRWHGALHFQLIELFGALSLASGISGYIFAYGALLLHSLGSRGSYEWHSAKRSATLALVLFSTSVGGRVFSGLLWIFNLGF
jgi:hypothetical protein